MYRQQTWSATPALSQKYTDKFATKHVRQMLQIAVKISAHMHPALVEGNKVKISLPMPTVCDISFAKTEICNCAAKATDSKQDVCCCLIMPGCLQESRSASSTELFYSYERTRTSVTAALCKKLKDLMAEFQALRMRLADEHR